MRGVVMADEITEIEVNGHRMPVVVCADTYPGAFIDVTQNRVWLHRGIPIEHRPALLADANLAGANLTRADLLGADLTDTKNAPQIICVGPIGSRRDYVTFELRDGVIHVRTGCFDGTMSKFASQVAKTHGDNEHAQAYRAACAMAETLLKNG